MKRPVIPTDSAAELAQGRIALWLNPDDLRWLAHTCNCPPDATEEQLERCARIRFRASAALHKASVTPDASPITPDEGSLSIL